MYSFIVTTPQSVLVVSPLKNKALLNKISDLFFAAFCPFKGPRPPTLFTTAFSFSQAAGPTQKATTPTPPPCKKKKGLSL